MFQNERSIEIVNFPLSNCLTAYVYGGSLGVIIFSYIVKQQHTAAPDGTSHTDVLTTRIASTATKANIVKTNRTLLNASATSPNITQPTSSSMLLSESTQYEPKQKEAIKTQKTTRVFNPNNLTFSTSARTSCCIPWFFFWVFLLFIISNWL